MTLPIDSETIRSIAGPITGAAIAVGTIFLKDISQERMEKKARKRAYIERQLREFYLSMSSLFDEVENRRKALREAFDINEDLDDRSDRLRAVDLGALQLKLKQHVESVNYKFKENVGLAEEDTRILFRDFDLFVQRLELEDDSPFVSSAWETWGELSDRLQQNFTYHCERLRSLLAK